MGKWFEQTLLQRWVSRALVACACRVQTARVTRQSNREVGLTLIGHKEKQIKTTWDSSSSSVGWLESRKKKKREITNACQGINENTHISDRNVKWWSTVSSPKAYVWSYCHHTAPLCVSNRTDRMDPCKMCVDRFVIVALAFFIMAKVWKQPKCLSVDEWINKLRHGPTTGHSSARNWFTLQYGWNTM